MKTSLYVKVLYGAIIALLFLQINFMLTSAEHMNYLTKQIESVKINLFRIEKILTAPEPMPEFKKPKGPLYVKLTVKVTAYSSERQQTDSTPFVAAWGHRVHRGMVAVSRDLEKLGITKGTPIFIHGRRYTVLDRMHWRKRRQVDIWMPSREEAVAWGVQYLEISVPLTETIMCKIFEHHKIKLIV